MKSGRIRIFVTTSHISTVYICLLAKKSKKEGDTDLLFIDTGSRRGELITLIEQTAESHSWHLVKNFSDSVSGDFDFNPSLRKRLTRRFRHWPVLLFFYKNALKKYMEQRDQRFTTEVAALLGKWKADPAMEFELFMMTQTYLNRPLHAYLPSAPIHYMEHGIGDYYYIFEKDVPDGDLYGVFAKPYAKYLASLPRKQFKVHEVPGLDQFAEFSLELSKRFILNEQLQFVNKITKPVVYLLLEAVDMYNMPENFWTEYPQHVLASLDDPKNYFFIIKPHPLQSRHSIVKTKQFFAASGLDHVLLENDEWSSCSGEVMFSIWMDRTKHVYCLFSSTCFYLSQLYSDRNIRFHYSTNFFSKYTYNAPPHIRKAYGEIVPFIENVFSEKCETY